MSLSILLDPKNGSTLLVSPQLDPNSREKQRFHVINGAWDGSFENGKVTYSKGVWEIHNDFDGVGDYNEVLEKFKEKLKQKS